MTPQDTSDHCSEDPIPTRSSPLGRLKDWEDQDSWRAFFDTYWWPIDNFSNRSGLTYEEAQEAVLETVGAVVVGACAKGAQVSVGVVKGSD